MSCTSTLGHTHTPTDHEVLDLTTVPAPARTARHAVRDLAAHWPLGDDAVHRLMLVATELVSNAERHGGGSTHLAVDRVGEMLCLSVADRGAGWDTPPATSAADHEESGRGLALVSALAERWGHHLRAGGGHEVWAILPP